MRRPPQLARPGGAAMRNVLRESLALRIEIDGGNALSELRSATATCIAIVDLPTPSLWLRAQ
jgi:hypothetical protein